MIEKLSAWWRYITLRGSSYKWKTLKMRCWGIHVDYIVYRGNRHSEAISFFNRSIIETRVMSMTYEGINKMDIFLIGIKFNLEIELFLRANGIILYFSISHTFLVQYIHTKCYYRRKNCAALAKGQKPQDLSSFIKISCIFFASRTTKVRPAG